MQVVGNHSCHSYFNWLKYNIIRGLPHCICELSRVLLKYTWETSSIFRRPYEIFRICQKMTEDFQRFPSCSPDVLITLILPFMYMFPQLKIRERTIWLKTAFLCVIGIFLSIYHTARGSWSLYKDYLVWLQRPTKSVPSSLRTDANVVVVV